MSNKKKEENQNILSDMGIDVSEDKIAIDTSKTKDFFGNIQQQIKDKAQNIGQNIKESGENLAQNIGVKLDDEHIEVDLNQSRSFIEEIGMKIEHFLASLEKSVEDFAKKK
ncbi:MAG: hypothetical protein ACWGHH_05075 [Sulfurovaceae bacterium]|jgi:uncharacterized protein YpuA (DUF1002 family)